MRLMTERSDLWSHNSHKQHYNRCLHSQTIMCCLEHLWMFVLCYCCVCVNVYSLYRTQMCYWKDAGKQKIVEIFLKNSEQFLCSETHDKSHNHWRENSQKHSGAHKSKEQFTQNRVNESSGLCDFKLNSFSRIPVLTPKFSFSGSSFSPLIFFSRHVHATFFTQASECLKALLSEDWAPRWRRHQKNFLLRYSACFYAGLFL